MKTLKPSQYFTKWYRLNIVFVMQHFRDVIKTFAALQIFFSIFLLKWELKSKRFWNSSLNLEFKVFDFNFLFSFFFSFFFLFIFLSSKILLLFSALQMIIFTTFFRRWSTLWNSMLKQRSKFQRWHTQCCFNVHLALRNVGDRRNKAWMQELLFTPSRNDLQEKKN